MEKKYLGVITFIVVLIVLLEDIICITALAKVTIMKIINFKAMDNATELSEKALGNKTSPSVIGELDNAKNNVSTALGYDQEMVKYAKTDSQKKYVEILINEADTMS